MSLDTKIWLKQLDDYPEVLECIGQSKTPLNALPSYEYLYTLKNKIPKELYARFLRKLLAYNTANVSVEFRLDMLQGVERDDLMYQEELDAIQSFAPKIVIYRGTSKDEEKPGLSWSLRRDVAESSYFYRGRLFIAEIATSSILLYLSKEDIEEEVIVHVTDNYKILDK